MIKIYKESLSSTQEVLKKQYKTYDHGTFLYTGYQTQGHGQYDRVWESKANKNVLCSLLLKSKTIYPNIQFEVSHMMMELLSSYEIHSTFKAPNDVMVENQKICGVIVDQLFVGDELQATIIGIGLNVNQEVFNLETATSMKKVTQLTYSLQEITSHIFQMLKRFI